jgi:iron complex outermembrane receptor protein
MKKIIFFLICLAPQNSEAQVKLSGKVTNRITHENLPGAIVYFPDLKSGASTGGNGTFELRNLPATKTLVQVKLIGYKTYIQVIDLSTISELNIEMDESIIEENEIVVTGVSKATEIKRNPVPMVFIDSKYLQNNPATNIIDALAKVPGVSALSTGPNVSKPYIRGLGYNRILTLFDGVRQEGQQWGDEHGIEIDQYLIERIEVVKGPASLIYGSDALAGVVNLLPGNPLPEGTIKADLQSNYQSNNKLRSVSLGNAGNIGGWIWGLRSSYKEAVDFQNRYDGRVFNTGYREKDLNAHIGVNRKWGYTHLNFGVYDNLQEIPDGSRDSTTRKFTKQITESDSLRPIVDQKELDSYQINSIHQRVQHYRIFSSSNFILRKSKLALRLGCQQSTRREYSHPEAPDLAGLDIKITTGTYDLKYYLPEKKEWESAIGLNGMYQLNTFGAATEFVIPEYTLFDLAPFAYAKKNIRKWDLAFGARYDTRSFQNKPLYLGIDPHTGFEMKVADTSQTKRFDEYRHTFSGFSGSFGATYNMTKEFLVKANISRGFRAPNISELSARGVHPGTGFEQLGNDNFKPEFSLQEDVGAFFDTEHLSVSVEVFHNNIQNYIFNQKLASLTGGDSLYFESGNSYPVFKFRQTRAQLFGGEARMDIHPHPLDWLHFENSVSIVYGQNLGGNGAILDHSNKYLPFIPPVHTNSEIRAEFRRKMRFFSDIFIKVGLQYYAAQNRAYLADNTETKTPAYALIDAGVGASIKNAKNKTLFTFAVLGSNLADAAYQSNMSRLKYFDNYPQNGTGRSGIYSMGRNISFKVTVPVNVKIK